MDVVLLIGRILMALIFLSSGFAHLVKREQMSQYAASKGVPAAGFLVPASGIMILAGGVMLAVGILPGIGALVLAAFLLPTAFLMHDFWNVEDAQQEQLQQAAFMKNVSLSGAALALFALYSIAGSAGFTVLGPAFAG